MCDKTSGVHIEKSVFSNGLTSPIFNSVTVRPRPIQNKIDFVNFYDKIPFGYCSVTTNGTLRILHASNNLFVVSTISGKYFIAGRNFSCKSHTKRIDVSHERGARR